MNTTLILKYLQAYLDINKYDMDESDRIELEDLIQSVEEASV